MDLEDWARMFGIMATLSGVLVVIGTLMEAEKEWSDWAMIVGAVLGTLGIGMTCMAMFGVSRWLDRHGQYPCLGSIGMGAVLFAMGFLMDQMRHRSAVRSREQLELMEKSTDGRDGRR